MLKITDIHKSYGMQKVLNGVSFELKKGKVCTLIGSNGSGKTTLLNIISGFIKADKGSIEFNNRNISGTTPFKVNRLGITRTFQDIRVIKNLTVEQHILLSLKRKKTRSIFGELKAFEKEDETSANNIIELVSLADVKNIPADKISYGQKKLLTIGCCIANDSEVLLIDEPISGIDKDNYKKIKELIHSIVSNGNKSILQVEHNLKYIEETTQSFIFLHEGISYVYNDIKSFRESELVSNNYLKIC